MCGEGAPGAHGADRVGGRGSDADAQQVEDAEQLFNLILLIVAFFLEAASLNI